MLAVPSVLAEVKPATWLAGSSAPDTYLGASPERLVDASGLSDPALAAAGSTLADLSGVTHIFGESFLDSWVTNAVIGDYFATNAAPVLAFDLGADAWLRDVVFWQYENNGSGVARSGNAARVVELRFSTSAEGPSFPAQPTAVVTLEDVDLGLGGINSPQFFSLGAGVRARFVQLTVTDNFFGMPGIVAGGDRVGIGEIRFNASDGAQTVMAAAPNRFELRSATIAAPGLTAVESGLNAWGLALDPLRERLVWTEPTSGRVGWTGYGSRQGQSGTVLSEPGRVLHGIDIDCENSRLYLLDSGSDLVLVFDLETEVLTPLSAAGIFVRPNAIDHDPEDHTLAVSDSGSDSIYLLDQGGAVLKSLASQESNGAWGVACDPISDLVFFTSHDRGELASWRPATGEVTTVATGLDQPRGLEIDRFGRIFCVEGGSGRIVEVDRGTGALAVTDFGTAPGGRDLIVFDAADTDGDLLLDWWEMREGRPLCALGSSGDPEHDLATALSEMLFNGTTTDRAGGSFGTVSPASAAGDATVKFEFETLLHESYQYELLLSDDLQNWHPSLAMPTFSSLGDGYYVMRTFVIDPTAEGLDPKAVFGQLRGRVIQAP